jgi:hypothetical protein
MVPFASLFFVSSLFCLSTISVCNCLLSVNAMADDGESDEQVVLVSQSGTVNRIKVGDISIQSRAAK